MRHALGLDDDPSPLFEHYDELGGSIGEALLTATHGLLPGGAARARFSQGHGAHHGRRPAETTCRECFPMGLGAHFDPATWTVPPIFTLLQELSNIDSDEMYHVFNMGLGMVVACDSESAERVCSLAPDARVVGKVVRATGERRVNL